jgi:G3E family GTPase
LHQFAIYLQVIDAKNFRLQIDEHKTSSSFPEAFHQIAFAVTRALSFSCSNHLTVIFSASSVLGFRYPFCRFQLQFNSLFNIQISTILCQIHVQDVVILNKIDLVKDDLEDLEMHIHDVNALVTVVKSVRCQVDLNRVFDRQAYGAKVSKELRT